MNEGPKRYARGTAEFHEYCGKHVQQMQAAIKLAVNTAIDERAPDPVLRVGELLVSRSVTFQTGGGSSSSEDAEIGHGAMGLRPMALNLPEGRLPPSPSLQSKTEGSN